MRSDSDLFQSSALLHTCSKASFQSPSTILQSSLATIIYTQAYRGGKSDREDRSLPLRCTQRDQGKGS